MRIGWETLVRQEVAANPARGETMGNQLIHSTGDTLCLMPYGGHCHGHISKKAGEVGLLSYQLHSNS